MYVTLWVDFVANVCLAALSTCTLRHQSTSMPSSCLSVTISSRAYDALLLFGERIFCLFDCVIFVSRETYRHYDDDDDDLITQE